MAPRTPGISCSSEQFNCADYTGRGGRFLHLLEKSQGEREISTPNTKIQPGQGVFQVLISYWGLLFQCGPRQERIAVIKFQLEAYNFVCIAELSVFLSVWICLCGGSPEAPTGNGILGFALGMS